MEKKAKDQICAIKKERKEKIASLMMGGQALPEVEHLIEKVEVHDLDDHVVTISSMDTLAMASESGVGLGRNDMPASDVQPKKKRIKNK